MFEEAVRAFTISYDVLNEANTFWGGELLTGRVVVEAANELRAESLDLSVRGVGETRWSEKDGDETLHYSASATYFKVKQLLIQKTPDGVVIPPGCHVYQFALQIPQMDLPSSFAGAHGKVRYFLKAKLHRPWHLASRAEKEFTVVRHIDINLPDLLSQQLGSKEKTLGCLCCTSGPIILNARIERKGYTPGDFIRVFTEVENGSSREVRPKVALQQLQTFHAQGKTKCVPKRIASLEGPPVGGRRRDAWSGGVLHIPPDTPISLLNCALMSVEYSVVVYVDIPRAFDIEVTFPVVIGTIPLHNPVY